MKARGEYASVKLGLGSRGGDLTQIAQGGTCAKPKLGGTSLSVGRNLQRKSSVEIFKA